MPEPVILHYESPSPFTPLGAKGVGEGNCMSTPVCLANAVADATGLTDLSLPLTPARLADRLQGEETPSKAPARPAVGGQRRLTGEGRAEVAASRETIWSMLLDPKTLEAVIPGPTGSRRSPTRISAPTSRWASGR